MIYDSQVIVRKATPMYFVKDAKKIAKDIKKRVDGDASTFDCMELDTESTYQITTYRDGVTIVCDCNFRRITPLQIEVEVQLYDRAYLKVSWISEGCINGKSGMAKITARATWQDGWYVWDDCAENGTPKAPYAEIYNKTL